MKVSTFNDGDRFIVVFEGISPSNEELIKGLIGGALTSERQPAVTPVETVEEAPPIIEKTFTDGPYSGKTPKEILDASPKDAQKAFKYLSETLSTEEDSGWLCCIYNAMEDYLQKRFKGIEDPDAYAQKLTDKQVDVFFNTFKAAMPVALFEDTEHRRENVSVIIKKYKN